MKIEDIESETGDFAYVDVQHHDGESFLHLTLTSKSQVSVVVCLQEEDLKLLVKELLRDLLNIDDLLASA